jgi:hypothetical protein
MRGAELLLETELRFSIFFLLWFKEITRSLPFSIGNFAKNTGTLGAAFLGGTLWFHAETRRRGVALQLIKSS